MFQMVENKPDGVSAILSVTVTVSVRVWLF